MQTWETLPTRNNPNRFGMIGAVYNENSRKKWKPRSYAPISQTGKWEDLSKREKAYLYAAHKKGQFTQHTGEAEGMDWLDDGRRNHSTAHYRAETEPAPKKTSSKYAKAVKDFVTKAVEKPAPVEVSMEVSAKDSYAQRLKEMAGELKTSDSKSKALLSTSRQLEKELKFHKASIVTLEQSVSTLKSASIAERRLFESKVKTLENALAIREKQVAKLATTQTQLAKYRLSLIRMKRYARALRMRAKRDREMYQRSLTDMNKQLQQRELELKAAGEHSLPSRVKNIRDAPFKAALNLGAVSEATSRSLSMVMGLAVVAYLWGRIE